MKTLRSFAGAVSSVLLTALAARGQIKSVVEHNDGGRGTGEFKFRNIPSPSKEDAATRAKFTIVAGTRDPAGADLDKLNDGRLPTEADGEIDVISSSATEVTPTSSATIPPFLIKSADGKCDITIDTSGATDLKEWAETKLAPVLAEWFPKIVEMLPSEGYTPPAGFSVTIRPGRGVAATSGTRVTANAAWLRRELEREAIGALLHEEIHVIQLYGRRGNRGEAGRRLPGWLVEGIPDYIRWFLYEPQSHGADDVWMKRQRFDSVRYDGSYRQTANFLNWVTEKYDPDIVAKLNAAARAGKYGDEIWKEKSGKTAQELGNEWKAQLAKKLDIDWTPPAADSNTNNATPTATSSNTATNK